MVQTYGLARENGEPTSHVAGDLEEDPLLGAPAAKPIHGGNATIVSSAVNLTNTIIGSGMLTFPLAMASVGILPGLVSCAFCGFVAAFGLYLLTVSARKAPHRRASFFAIADLTFPQAAVFFDAAIAVKCFGVSISYLIIIKSLMPNVVASIFHDLISPSTNPPWWALSERLWLTFFMAILIPLSFLRQLNSLRHTSYIALFAVAYLLTIVVTCYFYPLKGMPERGDISLIHFSPNFISTFPLQVFAFTCAQNVLPIYNELIDNTQERMDLAIKTSIGFSALTYAVIAVFGYLTFGSKVGANIIAMYPSTSLFIAIGQLAIVILVLFSYPLQVHPCRNCLDKVFQGDESLHQPKPVPTADNEQDCIDVEDELHGPPDMSPFKHVVLTTAIITSGYAISYFVSDLKIVLSFVGSTGSTVISFILPGLFYWKLHRYDRDANKYLTWAAFALFIYGMFIFGFSLTYSIYEIFGTSPIKA